MEACNKKLVVVMCLVVALALVANGADESIKCGMSMEGLISCEPAVTGSNPAKPTVKCCKALSDADLPCFCRFLKEDKATVESYGIDVNRAKKVPGLCKPSIPFKCY